jgi:hypothetical protein
VPPLLRKQPRRPRRQTGTKRSMSSGAASCMSNLFRKAVSPQALYLSIDLSLCCQLDAISNNSNKVPLICCISVGA